MPATPIKTARPRMAPEAEVHKEIGITAMPTAATAARHPYVRGARAAERASRAATGQRGISEPIHFRLDFFWLRPLLGGSTASEFQTQSVLGWSCHNVHEPIIDAATPLLFVPSDPTL